MFLPYDSTLLERVSTHDLARFCTSCANRFACLCFKSASKVSPPLSLFGSHFISLLSEVSHDEAKMRDLCWHGIISFFAKTENRVPRRLVFSLPRSQTETLALAWLFRLCSRASSLGICNRNCLDLCKPVCKRGRAALRKENDHKRSSS